MAKIKIIKKLPKAKKKQKATKKVVSPFKETNKFTDKYLEFYDDIKIPTKRYDW